MALEFVKLVKGKNVVSQVGSLGFLKLGVESGGGDIQFSRVFSENSPAVISAISAQISANNMTSAQVEETYGWKIGDTTNIALSTGEAIQMRIIGFNHDDKSDGSGKAGITLQMVNCLATLYVYHTVTITPGYPDSPLRKTTIPTIKLTLPQEWQDVIQMVDKKSADAGGNAYKETVTTSEDLFLLSEKEVFGIVTFAKEGDREGTQYEYWVGKGDADRIKNYDADGDGIAETPRSWWLRSAYNVAGALGCCGVKKTGATGVLSPTTTQGVSFAFCI